MNRLTARRVLALNKVIEYYGKNPSKRGTDGSICKYYDEVSGNRCAVGRMLTVKKAQDLQNYYPGGVAGSSTFSQLPSNVRSLGQDFLKDIQNLHDEEGNWSTKDNTWLTNEGLETVADIISKYSLPNNKIKLFQISL